MAETPLFIPSAGQQLFAMLHEPVAAPRGWFVFCHPFAEEKLWAHRVFVSFARTLADRGFAVLRFDMTGHGDSTGDFKDANVDVYLSDIGAVVAEATRRYPMAARRGLLGLRLGATLAVLAAERDADFSELVLWDPIVDGAKYAQEILLTNLATQMATHGKVVHERAELIAAMQTGATVNIDGYEMSPAMYTGIAALDLRQTPGAANGRCLITQIDRAPRPPRNDLQTVAQRYRSAALTQVVEQPFWKEIKEFYGRADNLYRETLTWLEQAA